MSDNKTVTVEEAIVSLIDSSAKIAQAISEIHKQLRVLAAEVVYLNQRLDIVAQQSDPRNHDMRAR